MNAEAERHLKALDSLIAIHHADTGQEAVKALAGIIRNLESEAATATAKLETAQAQAADLGDEAIRRGREIQRLEGVRDSLNRQLLASEERNKLQSEYLDKLRKAIGSNDWHDLDKLVEDVRKLVDERDRLLRKDREEEELYKQLVAAQQQSQPQPPNSYLAKEVERLQAEAVITGNRIKELKLELEQERSLRQKWENVTEVRVKNEPEITDQPLPCHTFQTHQPDPLADRISHLEREWRIHTDQIEALLNDLRAARDEANSLRAERDRYAKIIDRL